MRLHCILLGPFFPRLPASPPEGMGENEKPSRLSSGGVIAPTRGGAYTGREKDDEENRP